MGRHGAGVDGQRAGVRRHAAPVRRRGPALARRLDSGTVAGRARHRGVAARPHRRHPAGAGGAGDRLRRGCWESLGIVPDAVVGHSMGEVGAAHVAGALDLDQAMRIICRRSALMRRASGHGAMALVELSFDAAQARIAGREAQLAVAVSNSPRSSVISGDPQAVAEVMSELAARPGVLPPGQGRRRLAQPADGAAGRRARGRPGDAGPSAAALPIHSTVLARRVRGRRTGRRLLGAQSAPAGALRRHRRRA